LAAGGTAAIAAAAFTAGGFFVSGLATAGFDSTAARADFFGAGNFNVFDGALCDALGEAPAVGLLAFAAVFLAAGLRAFAGGVFDDVFDRARVAFPIGVLEDFLRVFLDIRLPFVAFSGSTIRTLAARVPRLGIEPVAGQIR
jgi:hypothetical protein